MPIVVIGLSHHTCPVDVRERFAFGDAEIPAALQRLRDQGLADEAVLLSTCNRVEIYAATSREADQAGAAIQRFLCDSRGSPEAANGMIYCHGEPHSLEHLFKVACGLDSLVLGETEILGQLKKAYDLALGLKLTGGRLNKAFQRAFNVAKQLRTETNIQRGSTSVGSVAVELAEKIFETLADHHVLVLGAGDTSEKTARALLSRGAGSVVVSNRTHERAVALAAELGGQAIPFDDWAAEFPRIDIVISSTSAPHFVIDRPRLEHLLRHRSHRPLLLIDIAVPRDIDPEVDRIDDVFLYNIDDLQAIADDYLRQRQEEIARCEAVIKDRARALLEARRPAGTASTG
jgi:glutamyl-tRNA reductase